MLYPDDDNPDHGDRSMAFIKALEEVKTNLPEVIKKLEKQKDWTQETQDALYEILPFEKKTKRRSREIKITPVETR